MQSSESFELGTTNYFNCIINPIPFSFYSAVLTYYWTINGVSSWTTSQSYTSLFISLSFTKYNYLFCKVKVNGGSILGIGQYLIKIKGESSYSFYTQMVLNQDKFIFVA